MKIETLSVDFTDDQKRYLEGFTTGLQISRVGRGLGGFLAPLLRHLAGFFLVLRDLHVAGLEARIEQQIFFEPVHDAAWAA